MAVQELFEVGPLQCLPADYRRLLTYSQGCWDNTKFWVELAWKIGLFDEATFDEIMEGYERLRGYEKLSMIIVRTLNRE